MTITDDDVSREDLAEALVNMAKHAKRQQHVYPGCPEVGRRACQARSDAERVGAGKSMTYTNTELRTDRPFLDRADWPSVGDEVLYHQFERGWIPATVLKVAEHDGDLMLDTGEGPALAALDSKHGADVHGWLLYSERP